jgi:hypothetical protein
MEDLLWFAAAGILFVLLHVAVATCLYRVAGATDADPVGEYLPASDGDERTVANRPDGDSEDRVPCPTCGVPNDPSFRFCRRCVADLKQSVTASTVTDGRKRLGS